jgi:hypothetical protein
MAGLPAAPPVLFANSFIDALESGFYSLFFMALGLLLVVGSYVRHRKGQLMRNTPTSEVESMSVGTVELNGTVEPAERTITPPLADDECVLVDYDVEEYRWSDDGKEWKTQSSGRAMAPFYLNDGTDRVLVDVDEYLMDYDVSEANRSRMKQDEETRSTGDLRDFLLEHTDEPVESSKPRRFTQEVIPVGEDVYVFGDAELPADVDPSVTPDDDASDLVVTRDSDTELFFLSDKEEAELLEARKHSLLVGGLAGIVLFSLGLLWFLSVLGV